jgi:hypothetical protein
MAELSKILDEMKIALETIDGLNVYKVTENISTPAAQIEPSKVSFDGAMKRGHERWEFIVRVLVSQASALAAQEEVFKYFGQAKDIKDAIESHIGLRDGSVSHDVFVRGAEDFGVWETAGVAYRGVQFRVEVHA